MDLWNGRVRHEPAAVARPGSVAEAAAVIRARGELPVSVLSGGYDWAGRSVRDGGLVVDLNDLDTVEIDPVQRIAVVGGGARTIDVVTAAAAHGLVVAAGYVGGVGFAGLALGGGYGPMSGLYGLALDNLLGVQMVLADGSVVDVDADHDQPLWWAIRGGGGNFGVVTSLRVALHPAEPMVAGFLCFDWTGAEQVWARLDEFLRDCPDRLTVQIGVLTGPDGAPALVVYAVWTGEPLQGEKHFARLRSFGTTTRDRVELTTYSQVLARHESLMPPGRRAEIRTRTVSRFGPAVISALIDAGTNATSPYSGIFTYHGHGAVTRVPVDATAFAYRMPHFVIGIAAIWLPGVHGNHQRWARAVSDALRPHALPGGYVNLIGPDETAQADAAYGRTTGLLLQVKRSHDPTGVFAATPLPNYPPAWQ
jgi:FAD/FMN-containing dehydrogenase